MDRPLPSEQRTSEGSPVPRAERAPSFQFYPADWLSDPAVDAMSFEQQGRYFRSLCMSWQTDSPGVAAESQWQKWMCLSDEEWTTQRAIFSAAFRVSSSGSWTQKRLALDRKLQKIRRSLSQNGAALTNEKRWGFVAGRPNKGRYASRSAISPSSSSSSSSSFASASSALSNAVVEAEAVAVFGQAIPPRLLRLFGFSLLREMAEQHPKRNVLAIAAKVADHDPAYGQPKNALRNWCQTADLKDLDRKPWDPSTWGREESNAAS